MESRLKKVAEHIELEARWYEDPALRAGDWLAFELPLMHALYGDLVLFVNAKNKQTRLLLHGSTRSLRPEDWTAAESTGRLPRAESDASFVYALEAASRSTSASSTSAPPVQVGQAEATQVLRMSVARTVARLDATLSTATGAWVQGFAQASAVLDMNHSQSFDAQGSGGASVSSTRVVVHRRCMSNVRLHPATRRIMTDDDRPGMSALVRVALV